LPLLVAASGCRLAEQNRAGYTVCAEVKTNVEERPQKEGRYNSQLAAKNALIGAESYRAQAGLYSAQAGWDTTAGYFRMGSSLLGGASSVSNRWLQYNLVGVNVFGSSSNPAGPEGLMG